MDGLTAREQEVAELVCDGMSNKEIARALAISDGTVKLHLHNVYAKLTVKNRAKLAALVTLERTVSASGTKVLSSNA